MYDLLDIRILSFTSGIISLNLCICMIYVSKTRKTYKGFNKWTIASILYTFALPLLSMRSILPDIFSVIAGNIFIIIGNVFIAYGLELFTDSAKKVWLHFSLTISTAILFLYFTYYKPDINARIIIMSGIIMIQYLYCAYLALRYIPRVIYSYNNFLMCIFSLQALWLAIRMIHSAFMESPIIDFMNAPSFHGLTVIVFFSGNILITISLIILNFQRVELDLSSTKKEVKTLQGLIPICSNCKKIRDDQGLWNQIEIYIRDHSDADFSHGICPECIKKLYP